MSALEFQGLNNHFHQQSRELASAWWLVERSQNSAAAIYWVTGLFLSAALPELHPKILSELGLPNRPMVGWELEEPWKGPAEG